MKLASVSFGCGEDDELFVRAVEFNFHGGSDVLVDKEARKERSKTRGFGSFSRLLFALLAHFFSDLVLRGCSSERQPYRSCNGA